jgi:hypothetical protein
MKMTKIALAVAALIGTTQAFAAPVTAAQITTARAAGTLQQAWISGASASTRSVYEGWVGSGTGVGCDVGTNTIFTNQALTNTNVTPGTIGNFFAYACTRSGVVSVLYHTVDGGSLNAFTPHTKATKLARMKFVGAAPAAGTETTTITALNNGVAFTGNGCTGSLTYTDTTNTENNATVFKGCTLIGSALPADGVATVASNTANGNATTADALAPQLPVGGFSDVEPAILPAALGGGDTAVNAKGTVSQANFGQAFGVIVSKPLYRALQVKQGIAANTDALDPNYDPANAPNITREQYAAIADQNGSYHTDWAPLIGAAGAGHKVILARRVNSSGTQASSTAFFMHTPCSASGLVPAAAADSTTSFEVFEGAGTGNVKTRLSTASTSVGTDNFAIGVVSLENDWRTDTSTATNGYRFVKLDGVHPEAGDTSITPTNGGNARTTATAGNYLFHEESYMFVANTATGFGASVLGAIDSALVNPPSAASCAVFPRGLTINPAAGATNCTVGGQGVTTAQVMNGTDFGNSCAPIEMTQ